MIWVKTSMDLNWQAVWIEWLMHIEVCIFLSYKRKGISTNGNRKNLACFLKQMSMDEIHIGIVHLLAAMLVWYVGRIKSIDKDESRIANWDKFICNVHILKVEIQCWSNKEQT